MQRLYYIDRNKAKKGYALLGLTRQYEPAVHVIDGRMLDATGQDVLDESRAVYKHHVRGRTV